jgi:hypothetical protein
MDERGRVVARDGVRAAREDGRHYPPAPANLGAADGVRTPKQRIQAAVLQAVLDRAPPEPQLDELPVRDNPMLPVRQLADPPVTWCLLLSYIDHK